MTYMMMLRRVRVPCPSCGDDHVHEIDLGVRGNYADMQKYWQARTKNGEYPDGSNLVMVMHTHPLKQVKFYEVWFEDYDDWETEQGS